MSPAIKLTTRDNTILLVRGDDAGRMLVTQGHQQPLGFERITALVAAASLTPPSGAISALIQAEGKSLRWRDDGVDPTASVGMFLLLGGDIWYSGDLTSLRLIEEGGAGAGIASVSYYK